MSLEVALRTALVIDDEIQIRRLMKVTLEAEQYRVYEAETGQAGLIEIAHRKPDVVLLDLGLPDMDGIEVLRRLREWSKVPVLILSVRQGVEDKVSALDAGADMVGFVFFSASPRHVSLETARVLGTIAILIAFTAITSYQFRGGGDGCGCGGEW